MRSRVEPLEGNKVKLSVEVEEDEFDQALDAAFRRLAQEVRIPGFRPGKAPRRLLEARLGPEAARQEALRESLPSFYERAVKEQDVEPIASPEIDITGGTESGPVAFDAVVEVRPHVSVAGYQGLRVVIPSPHVPESEVDRQVERLREQFGELRQVMRPAANGDHVSIDRKLYRHDETVLATTDELYEVGSGSIGAELDEQLRGARAGDILKFNAHLPETGEVTFQVLVKEVKEKVLPALTDEWAAEASEFETVAELRADIRARLDRIQRFQSIMALQERVVEALVELVDEEVPESLVAAEVERRLQDLVAQLAEQGSDLASYLEATNRTEAELAEHLREHALRAVKADLGLRALADSEGLQASDAEVDQEIERIAERLKEKPAAFRRRLERADRLPEVRSDVTKRKALEWLVEHVEVVDDEGHPIDRSDLRPPQATETSE